MAKQTINLGTAPAGAGGDDARTVRSSIRTEGGFSFTKTSLALVSLLEWDQPIINW